LELAQLDKISEDMFYKISTQAPAQMGKRTILDKKYTPWKVEKLHAIFDVWSDDDLLKTSPCYYVSERLFQTLTSSSLSGFELDADLDTDVSLTFKNLYPNKTIPRFILLNIVGNAGVDDFGLTDEGELILSEAAVELLRKFNTTETEIEIWNA
jgi:hypothetical protein